MKTHRQLHRFVIFTLSMVLVLLFFVRNAFSDTETMAKQFDPAYSPTLLPQEPADMLEIAQQTVNPLTGRQAATPLLVGEAEGVGTIDVDTTDVVKQFEETTYYLKDVAFASADTGWAVGLPYWNQAEKRYKGTIIKTMDGSETWTVQETGVVEALQEVAFVDANNGWVVGANGMILHTSNGGAQWSKQTVATTDEFLSVAFVDANTGWATSLKPVHYDWQDRPDNWEADVWHTSNGGQTWTQQTVPNGASILRGLTFINAQTGWVVGVKYTGDDQYGFPEHIAAIYHTSNGGQTWSEQYTPDLEVSLTTAHFIDADNGWAAGFPTRSSVEGGFVFYTTDGGQTWERQEPGDFFAPLWDIQFIDADRGYVVGFDYISAWGPPVWRTMDGGDTWEKVAMEGHESNGLFGLVVSEDRAVALGDHDYVVTSDDPWGPYSWPHGEELFTQAFINIHYRFEDVFFADQNHGWAVGSRSFILEHTGQVIFYTQDGGTTWTKQYEHAPDLDLFSYHRLDSVCFTDVQNGWAVGTSETFWNPDLPPAGGWEHHGAILHTTDGGQTWQEQGQELYDNWDLEFFAVHFLDSQNGWALAEGKFPSQNIHLAHTIDAGLHWQWVDTGIEGPLGIGFSLVQGDVLFTDAQHGWAAGGLGKVIYTADGGATWDAQTLSCGYPSCPWALFAIDFVDNQEGWLAGEAVYQTTDGGVNWSERDVDGYFQDVQLFDDGAGWLVGEQGVAMYTSNGGLRWHLLDSGTSFALRGLSFIGRTEGWMVGDYGTILRYRADHLPVEAELFLPVVIGQ